MTRRYERTLQPGFVLHQRDYQNSSRILDVLTRDQGRVSLVAKGIRRPNAKGRGLLRQFSLIHVSWVGRGPLFTLTDLEAGGRSGSLEGVALLSGFYVNELLMRLLPQDDPNPALFADYVQCLDQLQQDCIAPGLRIFEKRLLDHLGYGLNLEYDVVNQCAVDAHAHYQYQPDTGPRAVNDTGEDCYAGASLLQLAQETLMDDQALGDARKLLRTALDAHLGGRPLKSREVLMAMKRMLA